MPALGRPGEVEPGPDQQRALAHPGEAAVAGRGLGRAMPRPSSRTSSSTPPLPRAPAGAPPCSRRCGARRCQTLLGDAVDGQVLLGLQPRQVVGERLPHARARAVGDLRGERDERRAQPELVQRLRPQPAGDLAHVLHAAPRRLLRLADAGVQLRRRPALERLELEHDAGQRLADLVVQLAGEPAAPFSWAVSAGRCCAARPRGGRAWR